ncbi:glycosyltransferase family 2 protein [Modestobacter versicolor]|uniref:glycosyltransferase family 2 protein n=1 Tax=Modestobacter versicolor TaxID=429133 RepID=UPI0034DF4FFC
MTESPLLDVVVVTHDSGDVLAACLAPLTGHPDLTLVVVDSGSRSTTYLERFAAAGVRVVRQTNQGYGTSANVGAALGSAPWLAVLNPDVVVDADTLRALVDRARDCAVDALGPRLLDGEGREQDYPYRATTPYWRRPFRWKTLQTFGTCRETEVLNGSLVVFRRAVFERTGGFDTSFFLYAEEDDLVTRLRAAGARVARCADVSAVHLHEQGSGEVPGEWRGSQRLRGRAQYVAKHYSSVEAFLDVCLNLHRLVRRYGPAGTVRVIRGARVDPRASVTAPG